METKDTIDTMNPADNEGPTVAYLFSPQGTQYLGMGKELYEAFPSFAHVIDECDDIYKKLVGKSLKAGIWEDLKTLNDQDMSSPGIFSVQLGLVTLLKEFGLSASVVLGLSFGEFAAAVCAGVLTVEDGMRLVVGRAQLVKSQVLAGRLIVVKAPLEKVEQLVQKFQNLSTFSLDISAINSPQLIALGGLSQAITAFEQHCASEGVEFLGLNPSISYAYHSRCMDVILPQLKILAETLNHSLPACTYISSSTGKVLTYEDFSANYWINHTRNTIQFAEAVQLLPKFSKFVVEVGPSCNLQNLIIKNFTNPEEAPVVLHMMEPNRQSIKAFLSCLSQLVINGVNVDWSAWYARKFEIDSIWFNGSPGAARFMLSCHGNSFNDLEIIKFVKDTEICEYGVEVEVRATSLNYRDKFLILKPSGFQSGTSDRFGFDLSGVVTRVGSKVTKFRPSDEVYGIAMEGGSLASHVTTIEAHLAPKPTNLSFESAATISLTYIIAWKALIGIGKIGPQDRVLVNLGAGWIGSALVQICNFIGSEVFALSGSPERLKYLKSVGVKHTYDVRGKDFGDRILADTHGKGLTLIVNSFDTPKLKEESLRGCADDGYFVDICNVNNWSKEHFRSLRPNVRYGIVDLFNNTAQDDLSEIFALITAKVQNEIFQPFPHKNFPIDYAAEVFTLFDEGKIGMCKPVIVMPKYKILKEFF